MTISLSLRSAILFLLISGFLYCPLLSLKTSGATLMQNDSLTGENVKKWIETRIATAKLQKKMKANADQYDNVIQTFYEKRNALLESRGWTEQQFEALEKRINRATTGMDMAEELEETKAEHEQEIAEIKGNDHFSNDQKQQMIKVLQKMRDQKRDFVTKSKPDWPAVRPYRSTLEKLTDWVAGNIPDPPDVK